MNKKIATRLFIIINTIIVIAAATNDGVTGKFFGWGSIIFLALFLIDSFIQKRKIIYFIIPILLFLIFFSNLNNNFLIKSIKYQEIGYVVEVKSDWYVVNNEFIPNEMDLYTSKSMYKEKIDSQYGVNNGKDNNKTLLKKGDTFVLKSKFVTGHPDFATSYVYELSDFSNKNFEKSFLENSKKLEYDDCCERYFKYDRNNIYLDARSSGLEFSKSICAEENNCRENIFKIKEGDFKNIIGGPYINNSLWGKILFVVHINLLMFVLNPVVFIFWILINIKLMLSIIK